MFQYQLLHIFMRRKNLLKHILYDCVLEFLEAKSLFTIDMDTDNIHRSSLKYPRVFYQQQFYCSKYQSLFCDLNGLTFQLV